MLRPKKAVVALSLTYLRLTYYLQSISHDISSTFKIKCKPNHLSLFITTTLVLATTLSCLDHCTSLRAGLLSSIFEPLLSILHKASRVIFLTLKSNYVWHLSTSCSYMERTYCTTHHSYQAKSRNHKNLPNTPKPSKHKPVPLGGLPDIPGPFFFFFFLILSLLKWYFLACHPRLSPSSPTTFLAPVSQ